MFFLEDSKDNSGIEHLIVRFILGTISDSELFVLDRWRKESPKNEALFNKLISLDNFNKNVEKFVVSDDDLDKEWEKIRKKIRFPKSRKEIFILYARYAAIFIIPLIIAAGIFLSQYNSSKVIEKKTKDNEIFASISYNGSKARLVLPEGDVVSLGGTNGGERAISQNSGLKEVGDTLKYGKSARNASLAPVYHTLIVPRGSDFSVVLSDGTKVYLNSETELRYPPNFAADKRTVFVKGEAYFEVTKDFKRPFIVNMGGVQVKVLGTSFATRFFDNEREALTTLVEGSVALTCLSKTCMLSPGQQAVVDYKSDELRIKDVNTELYTSWKDGKIVFDRTPLHKILSYLSRIYSVDFSYDNPDVRNISFSINISKYDSFLQIKELLEKTDRVSFEIQDLKTIRVK